MYARGKHLRSWFSNQLGSRARELPNYQRSREELGGLPWRKFDQTERWFLQSASELEASDDPISLTPDSADSIAPAASPRLEESILPKAEPGEALASYDLRPAPLSLRLRLVIAGGVVMSILVAVLASRGPAATIAPAPVAAPVAAAPVPTPVLSPQPQRPARAVASSGRPVARKPVPDRPLKRQIKKGHRGAAASWIRRPA